MPINPDEDRYKPIAKAVSEVLKHPNLPEGPISKLEVFLEAGGDVTFRAWPPRAEEPEGGAIPGA